MSKAKFILPLLFLTLFADCKKQPVDEFVLIKGGSFNHPGSNYHDSTISLPDYYISRYEITQQQWEKVMGTNPSAFKGDKLPVEMVSWYDCIEYCNRRSILEGLEPCYSIKKQETDTVNRNKLDDIKWVVEMDFNANGYRLPTEAEWEYAASGGQKSKGYTYSGSNKILSVAWFWRNSGDAYLEGDWIWDRIEKNNCRTREVGLKAPNELGLFDMSGNVREWCWDQYKDNQLRKEHGRVWRGGGWMGGKHACAISYRGVFEANGKGPDQGLRVVRNTQQIKNNITTNQQQSVKKGLNAETQ